MAIVKWDPFRDMLSLRDRMDRLFDDSLSRMRGPEDATPHSAWSPAVDVYETSDNLVLKAELPGIKKEDVSVEVKDNTLSMKGERKFEKDIEEENYHRMERAYGSFYRLFSLPTTVDPDKIRASFKNGVLEITVPKIEVEKPKQITVDLE